MTRKRDEINQNIRRQILTIQTTEQEAEQTSRILRGKVPTNNAKKKQTITKQELITPNEEVLQGNLNSHQTYLPCSTFSFFFF